MAKKPATVVAAPKKPATPTPAPSPAPMTAKAPPAPVAKPMVANPPAAPVTASAVRNSPVPKVARPAAPAPVAKNEVTQADIARRAYDIWASGQGGSETDNWLRAERELRGV